jgi:hypothetical protein
MYVFHQLDVLNLHKIVNAQKPYKVNVIKF